ncbi:MAG: cupin domain-containing protein, partial [Verrucomicrobia bacterium]|nr:cupin domain-containing protein [Verrucomicrobiota bacterium]
MEGVQIRCRGQSQWDHARQRLQAPQDIALLNPCKKTQNDSIPHIVHDFGSQPETSPLRLLFLGQNPLQLFSGARLCQIRGKLLIQPTFGRFPKVEDFSAGHQFDRRFGLDPYLDWVAKEGIPVTEDYGIDLFKVETAMWPRFGVKGAAVHLIGRGDFTNMFLLDIPPGGSTTPQRHLYEDVYYVLEGTGSTQVEFDDGTKRSFEWGPKSLFAIPLNAKHRHFNGSGRERALLVTTTDMPLVMNTFHNEKFIFDN